jgi:hypothetical protein
MVAPTQVAPGTKVMLEPAGMVSLPVTVVVVGWLGCGLAVSSRASMTGTAGLVMLQLVPLGQLGSPPPLMLAVLLAALAPAATLTGMSMMMVPVLAPLAMVQLPKVMPLLAQPFSVPLLVLLAARTGAPLKVMPVGKVSARLMAAVVGPLATVTVRVYF